MPKTFPGKQWGNVQSNALDAPDWGYLQTKRIGFLTAETSTYTAANGVFTPDGVVANVAAQIAASQSVLVNGVDEYDVASVNSSTFTVSDANATYANASIRESVLSAPQSPIASNNQPSATGWEVEHPWVAGSGAVKEVLVAIGGLKMPALNVAFLELHTPVVANGAAVPLELLVQFNSGVVVTDANTSNVYVTAIGENANVANVNLIYSPTDSKPQSGVLVFKATADLHLDVNADTLTINSTSNIHNFGAIVSYKKKGPALAATSGFVGRDNVATGAVVITITV